MMVTLKYFLLLLGFCGLCHPGLGQQCSTSGIWGRASSTPYPSRKSTIPSGYKTFTLEIPNGHFICYGTAQKYFVGEEVRVCDHTYPPTVQFENNKPNSAIVIRNGMLQQEATAQTIYYCDAHK